MASGLLKDYIGIGIASARPATLALSSNTAGYWYSTDTGEFSVWDGTTWKTISGGSSGAAVVALSISSGVVNIDLSLGQNFTLALTANVTSITFSNMPGSGFSAEFELQITQDATGGRTLVLPAAFKALGGSDTAIASAANAVTVLSAKSFDNGTTWRYAMQESA